MINEIQTGQGRCSALDVSLLKEFPQLFFHECVRCVGVVFSVDALRRQLLEVALHLGRSRDRDLDGLQRIFGASHLGLERDKNEVFIR
jgi:hypothetical protein